MKSPTVHEYDESPKAKSRFENAVKKILNVSREEMERREKEYQKQQALKPKRGPKPKTSANLLRTLAAMHVAGLAADHAFIYFNVTGQLAALFVLHSQTDAMEHEPGGLLSNAKSAMEFPRTNPVLVIDDHPDGRKPLIQTERAFLKDSPSLETELWAFVLGVTLPNAGFLQILHMPRAAARTNYFAVWPAQFDHEFVAVLVILKEGDGLNQSASKFHNLESSN